MATLHHIADADDPRCAPYRNVPDPELLARGGIFVAEGRLVVRRLLESALAVESLMVTPPALAALHDLPDRHPDLPILVVPQAVMNGIIGFNIHRGCLAIGQRPAERPWQTVAAGATRVLILERIANADNVGAAFRNAAAFGVDAVLIGPACADPFYRKAIRTSMGTVLTLPFAHARPWPDVLHALRADGWAVVGLTPHDAAPLAGVVERVAGGAVALVAGHEGEGLTASAMEACTHRARIPMSQGVDSLNIATAAAVALYELRTRTQEGEP